MTITTKNALETRDSLRKALFGNQPVAMDEEEAALDESQKSQKNLDKSDATAVAADKKQEDSRVKEGEASNKAPVEGDDVGTSDAGNKQEGEKGKDTASATEGEGKKAEKPEPVAKDKDDSKPVTDKDWRAEFRKMERQFKAIQSAVTPTQQKNSRLEKEVADLRAKLEEVAAKPKVDEKNLPEVFEKIREVFPEGADLIEDLYTRTKQVDRVQEQITQRDEQAAASRRDAVIGQIVHAHPEAQEMIKDEKFWKWVQSHDPGAVDFMTNVIAKPWEQDPQLAIDIFSDYKEETTPRRQTPPAPAKPAPKTPADIAPSSRDLQDESRVAPNGNQGKVWSDKDWADARRKLNANGLDWKAKDELRKEMRRQLSLKSS